MTDEGEAQIGETARLLAAQEQELARLRAQLAAQSAGIDQLRAALGGEADLVAAVERLQGRLAEAERERDHQRRIADARADHERELFGALTASREALTAARAERDKYHDALVARHGGEPVALLAELDAARTKLAEAERAIETQRQQCQAFEGEVMYEHERDLAAAQAEAADWHATADRRAARIVEQDTAIAHWHRQCEMATLQRDEARAEAGRLREALAKVLPYFSLKADSWARDFVDIIDAALAPPSTPVAGAPGKGGGEQNASLDCVDPECPDHGPRPGLESAPASPGTGDGGMQSPSVSPPEGPVPSSGVKCERCGAANAIPGFSAESLCRDCTIGDMQSTINRLRADLHDAKVRLIRKNNMLNRAWSAAKERDRG